MVGEPAPELSVTSLDGTPLDLARLRGRVVLVSMWATWCKACKQEMPALDAFYRQHHAQGIEIIALSSDRPRDRENVAKYMGSLSYPAAMITDARPNGFGSPTSLPMTYVIDTDGVVRAQMSPDGTPVTAKNLDDIVLPLLPMQHPQARNVRTRVVKDNAQDWHPAVIPAKITE